MRLQIPRELLGHVAGVEPAVARDARRSFLEDGKEVRVVLNQIADLLGRQAERLLGRQVLSVGEARRQAVSRSRRAAIRIEQPDDGP